jgi:hypothetical protein
MYLHNARRNVHKQLKRALHMPDRATARQRIVDADYRQRLEGRKVEPVGEVR